MDYVYEARDEFNKRKALLGNRLVPELASIVVSFAVTEYQLFEESLLRRHFVADTRCRMWLFERLNETPHVLTQQYIRELNNADMRPYNVRDTKQKITSAMSVIGAGNQCCRLRCYYYTKACTCCRTLLSENIQNGLVMPF